MTGAAEILARCEHRPWPLPRAPWVMTQRWHDLLFAHWSVDPGVLRALVPPALELDLFDGRAWLGIVPFRMSGVRLRCLPALGRTGAFEELNVRTYVRRSDRPGVWFFSLDAVSPLAVRVARSWFHLPYFRAHMRLEEQDGRIRYRSERARQGASAASAARLVLEYGPDPGAQSFEPRAGTLEHFLTERYRLYAADARGGIRRGEIHHPPWKLQSAWAELTTNTMAEACGIELAQRPPELLHFARLQETLIWPLGTETADQLGSPSATTRSSASEKRSSSLFVV